MQRVDMIYLVVSFVYSYLGFESDTESNS